MAVLIAAIVLLQVLPFGYAAVGAPALVALALGALAPLGGEHVPGGERVVVLLATVGLGLHGFLDGTALVGHAAGGAPGLVGHAAGGAPGLVGHAAGGAPGLDGAAGLGEAASFGEAVAHGIILHSLPFGLGVWRSLSGRAPALGWAVLGAVAVGELAGYAVGASLPPEWTVALGALQCFVAGSLLHLLGHAAAGTTHPRASGMGALLGIFGAIALWVDEPPPHLGDRTAAMVLWSLASAQAPAALLAWGGLTLLTRSTGPMRGRRIASAVAVATSFGLLGAAFAAVVAPLLALGERFGGGPRSAPPPPSQQAHAPHAHASHGHAAHGHASHGHAAHGHGAHGHAPIEDETANPAAIAFSRILDRSLPALIGATLLAAILGSLLPPGALTLATPTTQVVIAAFLGVPLYISPVAVLPLLAVLGPSGLTGGAALALLLTSPAWNLPSLLREVRNRGVVGALGRPTLVLFGAIGGGLAWNHTGMDTRLFGSWGAPPGAPSLFGNLSIAVVTALAVEALLRRGLSGFLEPLLHPHAHPPEGSDRPPLNSMG